MRYLLLLLGLILAAPAQAQSGDAGRIYPAFEITAPELAPAPSGLAPLGARVIDILPPAGPGAFVLRRIVWWERGDKPCRLEATFEDVNSGAELTRPAAGDCVVGNFSRKSLSLSDDAARLDGLPGGMTVCLNNDRLKGIRARLLEPAGADSETTTADGTLVARFDPILLAPALDGPGRVALRDAGVDRAEATRPNCRADGWAAPARCNAGLNGLQRTITGLRVILVTDDLNDLASAPQADKDVIAGLQPFCSHLTVMPARRG